jgi:hypothetical protein
MISRKFTNEITGNASQLSFPQAKRVGNPSENKRKIPDKPE